MSEIDFLKFLKSSDCMNYMVFERTDSFNLQIYGNVNINGFWVEFNIKSE